MKFKLVWQENIYERDDYDGLRLGKRLQAANLTASTDDEVVAEMKSIGFEQSGIEESRCRREELRGRPTFKNLCGPMWDGEEDGEPIIRYETWDAYDTLSI